MNNAELLARYDEQLRGRVESEGAPTDVDGPLIRVHYSHRGFVSYRTLDGLSDPQLDELIDRQIAHFATLGQPFEWKLRSHDKPADLADRLRAKGFVPEPTETVVVGVATDLAHDPVLPDGVTMRAVHDRADLERIAAMETRVWSDDRSWHADDLAARVTDAPQDIVILVAEASGDVVAAGWIVFTPGADFAGLWGGSTLASWRRRGIYHALVARRAQLAAARGVRYLQVDASDDSRPILERLGFVAITTTTPFIWTPAA
jgi:GNAT superfamily N-acetyltransferase